MFEIVKGSPAVVCDPALTARVREAAVAWVGQENVVDMELRMGAEDFAYFVAPDTGVKGVYFSVGGTPAEAVASAPSHHSSFFKVDPQAAISTGTEAMVTAALTLLGPSANP